MKQRITIKIAGKSYPMTIERGNEELYRLAERRLSEMITTIEQQKIVDFSTQDNIAIASFMLAVDSIDFQRKGSVTDEDREHIERLNGELDDYLNELS
ncbi:MAG: cell division protein ZapA [Rikenellaceae bacterium]